MEYGKPKHSLWDYISNYMGSLPTYTKSLPGARKTSSFSSFVFNGKQSLLFFLPKISWSNWNSGWKITFLQANAVWKAAHRSKRPPEFFPNYLKPHFEGWRRRGLRLHFWTEYGAPFILWGEEEGKTSLLSELIIFPKSRFNSVLWFPQKTGSTYMVTWIKLCSCSICYVYRTVWITFLSEKKKCVGIINLKSPEVCKIAAGTTVITGGDNLVLTSWPLGAASIYLMQ